MRLKRGTQKGISTNEQVIIPTPLSWTTSHVSSPFLKCASQTDPCSIPMSGRSPGGGHNNPLQYSCLENPLDRGAWRATVHRVAKVRHDWNTTARMRKTYIILKLASGLVYSQKHEAVAPTTQVSACQRLEVGTGVLSCFSRVPLFATPWTVARQAPLSKGLFRQEYRNGLPFPSPGDLPHWRTEPTSLMSPALAGGFIIYH